ncbi:MAG: UvrD-helicase domain-containing protein [Planctomycetota bacterium]
MSTASKKPARRRQFAHQLIRASAGTGKTFQLTNRYLELLVADEPHDAILATTFTRKAAGEILERVLLRLAEAAIDAKKLAAIEKAIPAPGLDRSGCLAILERAVRRMHRLRVGTLDSFFQQLARSFSLELGLPPGWQIVDELTDQRIRAEAVRNVLDEEAPGDLARLMQLLTKAESNRKVAEEIAELVDTLYGIYCESPAEAWHALPRPKQLRPEELEAAIERLAGAELPKHQTFAKTHAQLVEHARARAWESFIANGLTQKVLGGETRYCQKEIPGDLADVISLFVCEAKAEMLGAIANQNEATYRLLERFDRCYTRLKQNRGVLRFEDVTRILAQALNTPAVGDVSHRLDARLTHLLLDEFQDTSVLQWRVLRPLAQEVTGSGEHLFFCVGDAKQAIYGWRGGVAGIFDVLPHELGRLDEQPLDQSWRSAPPVIDTVNRIFESLTENPALGRYADAAAAWTKRFHVHSTARRELPGHCRLVVAPRADEDENQTECTLRFAAAEIKRLHEAMPDRSIGVLVRKNASVARVIFELRQLEVEASEEGGNPLSDSAAVQIVLSLLKLADHPGDTTARFHVVHSPLAAEVGLTDHADDRAAMGLSLRLRQMLLEQGYGPALYSFAEKLAPHCDRRDLDRLMQLIEAAYDYQPQATPRADDFVEMVEGTRIPSPKPSAIRVMTIHQSKGLQFDVVVLPDLGLNLRGQSTRVVFRRAETGGAIERICRYVKKDWRELLPENFQRMFCEYERVVIEEALCLLYVALTRPIHALQMVIPPSAEKEKTVPATAAGVLRCALAAGAPATPGAVLYEHGDPEWHSGDRVTRAVKSRSDLTEQAASRSRQGEALAIRMARKPERRRSFVRRSPSQLEGGSMVALTGLLKLEDDAALGIGQLVHDWFSQIEWLDDGPPDDAALQTVASRAAYRTVDAAAALARFRAALEQPAIAAELRRQTREVPGASEYEVWRERAFAVTDADVLLSGRFDRVVLRRAGEKYLSAVVLDFKTDRVPAEAVPERVEVYRPQMDAYRRALSLLLGLPVEQIATKLLFLEPGVVMEVGGAC